MGQNHHGAISSCFLFSPGLVQVTKPITDLSAGKITGNRDPMAHSTLSLRLNATARYCFVDQGGNDTGMEAFDNYRRGKASVAGVTCSLVGDATPRMLSLMSAQADLIAPLEPEPEFITSTRCYPNTGEYYRERIAAHLQEERFPVTLSVMEVAASDKRLSDRPGGGPGHMIDRGKPRVFPILTWC